MKHLKNTAIMLCLAIGLAATAARADVSIGYFDTIKSAPAVVAGQTYYLRHGLMFEKDEWDATNYWRGVFLPINTQVKVASISSSSMIITWGDNTLKIKNNGHTKIGMAALAKRMLSPNPVPIEKFGADMAGIILRGEVVEGMTREQMIMSHGYPPAHKTPTISQDNGKWVYWSSRYVTVTYVFKDGKLAAGRGITSGAGDAGNSQSISSQPPDEAEGTLSGNGTGFIISEDGFIVTAAHVVKGATSIKVLTEQGLLKATIEQVDTANDIALLHCSGQFTPLPIVNSNTVRVGQSVFTIGFPQIRLQGFNPKYTKGDISSKTGLQDDPTQWQISVPIQPGNSGGPLFDENGNIIGIVVAALNPAITIQRNGNLPQNVNYAVKSAYIYPLLDKKIVLAPIKKSSVSPEDIVEQAQKSVVMVLVYTNLRR